MPLPWTTAQWQQLTAAAGADRLPHGLILHGLAGLGKFALACEFSQFLLCQTPQAQTACGRCRSCQQFVARTHPDFDLLEPEEVGKSIKVAQLRTFIAGLGLASHYGRYRIAVIRPADSMNPAAANSLLKSLEEPPPGAILILVTHRLSSLLPTIKSRCQHLQFHAPDSTTAQNWLKNNHNFSDDKARAALALAHGAPLAALELAESDELSLREQAFGHFYQVGIGAEASLPLCAAWLKQDLPEPINWLYSWVSDLVKLKCQTTDELRNTDQSENLHKLAQHVELNGLMAYLDTLTSLLKRQRVALNPQMTMEELLTRWQWVSRGQ